MDIGEERPLYYWLVITGFILTGAFWIWHAGIISTIWESDVTKITAIIASLFTVAHLWMGYETTKLVKSGMYAINTQFTHAYKACAFIANQLPTLGLIGTVVGFILLMITSINGIGVTITDTASVTELFQQISISMGTALYTTVVGLVGALILRAQLFIYSYILRLEG